MKNRQSLEPRWVRASDAPGYLAMCRNEFNKTVRPFVLEIPIGQSGVAFDKKELDQWADDYIANNAVAKKAPIIDKGTAAHDDSNRSERCREKGATKWPAKQSAVSRAKGRSGTSTKSLTDSAFAKALEQARGKKPRSS